MKKPTQKHQEREMISGRAPHSAIEPVRPLRVRFRSREMIDLAMILGLALVLRILFFFLNKHNNPLFLYPIMDALYHDEWAKKIVSGEFWGHEVFFRAPLYPYLLAFIYKMSGSSIAAAIFVQHLTGAASAGLTYILGRLYFKRSVALIAGCAAALYWPFIYFEGQLLLVTLAIFFDLLVLIALTISLHAPRRRSLLFAGILFGLSAITRPSILILIPALPLVFYFSMNRTATVSRWKRAVVSRALLPSLFVCAGALLIVAPIVVRNYVVGSDFVPIASQGGVNFYIGNNPQSDGRTAIVPGTRPDWWGGYYDAIGMAEKSEGRALQPSEVSNYFFKRGLAFWRSSPGDAARLFVHKFRLFWSGGERANNMNIYFFWRITGMGSVPLPGFWLVCPLGLLGMILMWRKRRELSLLYLFIACYSAGVIAFFVNARFRLPVVPLLLLFAACAAVSLVSMRRSSIIRFTLALLGLALLALTVNADFMTFKENTVYADAFSRYSIGNAYLKMNLKDLALEEYRKAYDLSRKYPVSSFSLIERNVNHNLGTLYWEQGRCDKAIEHLSRVGGSDSYALLAKRYLAECYRKEGMFPQAVRSYEEALAIDPSDHESLLGLGELYLQRGNTAQAQQVFSRARRLYPGDARVDSLGRALDAR